MSPKKATTSRKASFESLEGRKLLSANSFNLSQTSAVAEVGANSLVGDDIGIPRNGRIMKMVYTGNPDLD